MKKLAAGILLVVASTAHAGDTVSKSRVWAEDFAVISRSPQLTVKNVWGSVRVRPGPDGQISMTVDERYSAPDYELLERSLETLKLSIEADADGVSIAVGDGTHRWQRLDSCRGCRADYQFDVRVPAGTRVDVGTVVDGAIDVAGVAGIVSASNVNGPISVRDLRECSFFESVNGAVELAFAQAPGRDCDIETINGNVTLLLPDGSGLDVALDSFNGSVFSAFRVDSFRVPATVEHTTDSGRNRYRIQQSAGLRLEGGGPLFSISSLNGDIRIQKQ